MSTTLRILFLRALKEIGLKHFRTRSGLRLPFICHLGDSNGEMSFYNLESGVAEIAIMSGWSQQFEDPLIFDIGGNVGFIATQLAQMVKENRPLILSFEPVPHTFQLLARSIKLLGLQDYIHPICCALSDEARLSRIWYSEWDTMFAQVANAQPDRRIGNRSIWCATLTADQICATVAKSPCLIKVDVEGHEGKVFEGARKLLARADRPGICFELNPLTLGESQSSVADLANCLPEYDFFYVSDFEHQRIKFGEPIKDITHIDWVCNLFAVPRTEIAKRRWSAALSRAEEIMGYAVRTD